MFLYRWLRKIIEYLTDYPADDELAKEFMWAWRLTGFTPYVSRIGDGIEFKFKNNCMVYWCYSMRNNPDKFHIGNIDASIFHQKKRFRKICYLISKHLKFPEDGCSKEEAVLFCAQAVNIEKLYPNEEPSEYLEFDTIHFFLRF